MPPWITSLVMVSVLALQTDVQTAVREAAALERAGNTAGALESYAWALGESTPATRERGEILIALASLKTGLGKYEEARTHARAAQVAFEGAGDVAGVSVAHNTAGRAYVYEADYAAAEREFLAAVELSKRAGVPKLQAEQLGNLANVHFFFGRYADAARLNDEALAIATGAGAEAWAPGRRRVLLVNQAILYQRIGREQQALELYEEVQATATALRPSEEAQYLTNLGVLYRRLGDPIKALETYDKARALFSGDRNINGELSALKNRGIVLALDLGRYADAEESFTAALTTSLRSGNRRETVHARLYRGETFLREGQRARAREDFAAALPLTRELKIPEEEWKALYGLGRTATDSAEAIDYLKRALKTIEEIRENIRVPSLRTEFLNDKREVYDALISRGHGSASVAETFELLERSHSRGWRDKLGLSGAVDLARVQRALAPGVLLLDYWHSAAGAAVIAVTRDRAAMLPVDVSSQHIKRMIDSLSTGPGQALSTDTGVRLLPDASWFDGIRHLIVVPDGAVALVPFDLLQIEGRPLIERATVTYSPTAATVLREPSRISGWRMPWQLELTALAKPAFTRAGLDDASSINAGIEASGVEVRQIAAELAGRTAIHLGADNRKAHLFSVHAPLLHLATHAVADANAMEQSRIVFSAADGSGTSADYLFLKEAYDLPLGEVELAVLSACDTERGELMRGEGVQSFSRAFLAAGARSTVTTLWRVADGPTAEFMTIFYHHLQRGEARAEALRLAKLRFIRSGTALADPHYWAAFVLTGDGLRSVPRAVSWMWLALILALSGTTTAVAVLWARR